MSLWRHSESLTRFSMDCGFWRSLKWSGRRSLAAVGLQACAVSYCNEHLTDGRLPRDPADLAVALGLPEREIRKTLPIMLQPGSGTPALWTQIGDEIEIAGYLGHNPSRTDALKHRQKRTAAALKANHDRHHTQKGISDPDCPLCSDTGPPSDPIRSDFDSVCGLQEESRGEESSKDPPPQVPPKLRSVPDRPDDEEESKLGKPQVIGHAVALLVERRRQARSPDAGRIVDQKRWSEVVTAQIRAEHEPELALMADIGLSPAEMADRIDKPAGHSTLPKPVPWIPDQPDEPVSGPKPGWRRRAEEAG